MFGSHISGQTLQKVNSHCGYSDIDILDVIWRKQQWNNVSELLLLHVNGLHLCIFINTSSYSTSR